MPSRTTLWRRKKSGGKLSRRGRHTEEERQERLNFIGAVVAQLLESGHATHHGLKKYLSGATEFDPREAFEGQRITWAKPIKAVWDMIEAAPHNADCLAIAAAYIGKLVAVKRHGSLRGKQHLDSRPQREGSNMIYWQAIEGMTKQTAHYWRERRKSDYDKTVKWLAMLLKRHGLSESPAKGEATYFRDDIDSRLTRIVRGKEAEFEDREREYREKLADGKA